MYRTLYSFIHQLDTTVIADNRKEKLKLLSTYITSHLHSPSGIKLNFICTHNSRRSHLSQAWAQAMASFYGVKNVHCFSGGTEATSVYPMIIETLQASGFEIQRMSEEDNPIYHIRCSEEEEPLIAFSKKIDHELNPSADFAAVMTCSEADQGCPFVPGAAARISLPFDDPKAFDQTAFQREKYMERNVQIATELKFIFSNL